MIRIILDNVGMSLAIAVLWFSYIPLRSNLKLILSTMVVLVLALAATFNITFVTNNLLLAWHGAAIVLCFLAINAVTSKRPNPTSIMARQSFRDEHNLLYLSQRRPNPMIIIALLIISISSISHFIHFFSLFPKFLANLNQVL